jgi:hypothetical protein
MDTIHLLFFKIYKRGLERAGRVAFSKHGPLSGFPYYNLKKTFERASFIHHPGTC